MARQKNRLAVKSARTGCHYKLIAMLADHSVKMPPYAFCVIGHTPRFSTIRSANTKTGCDRNDPPWYSGQNYLKLK
jgi:hypothetical protein